MCGMMVSVCVCIGRRIGVERSGEEGWRGGMERRDGEKGEIEKGWRGMMERRDGEEGEGEEGERRERREGVGRGRGKGQKEGTKARGRGKEKVSSPGSSFASSAHLFPVFECVDRMMRSSSSLQGALLMSGLR